MNRKWYCLTILLLISGAVVFSEEPIDNDENNILNAYKVNSAKHPELPEGGLIGAVFEHFSPPLGDIGGCIQYILWYAVLT